MKTSRIDEAILSVTQPHWRKVAMIIGKTADVEGVGVTMLMKDTRLSLPGLRH